MNHSYSIGVGHLTDGTDGTASRLSLLMIQPGTELAESQIKQSASNLRNSDFRSTRRYFTLS